MTREKEVSRTICAECGEPNVWGDEVDYSYRTGPDGIEVVRAVCPRCDDEIYGEAVGMVP